MRHPAREQPDAQRAQRHARSSAAISESPASRSRYSVISFAAPFVSAWSTAWLEKSWPTAKLCVSIALIA